LAEPWKVDTAAVLRDVGWMHDPRPTPIDPGGMERDLHEEVGYARCQLDQAVAKLRETEQRRDELAGRCTELARQIEVVDAEVAALRRRLLDRLGAWCSLDELDQRASSDVIRRIDAVRGSSTYRITAGVLHLLNKVRRFVTLQWLRGGSS